jgi:hypothetical protein
LATARGWIGNSEGTVRTLSPFIKRFGGTLSAPIRDRIRMWKSKRHSKLFGMNAPNKAFLPSHWSAAPNLFQQNYIKIIELTLPRNPEKSGLKHRHWFTGFTSLIDFTS